MSTTKQVCVVRSKPQTDLLLRIIRDKSSGHIGALFVGSAAMDAIMDLSPDMINLCNQSFSPQSKGGVMVPVMAPINPGCPKCGFGRSAIWLSNIVDERHVDCVLLVLPICDSESESAKQLGALSSCIRKMIGAVTCTDEVEC